MTTIAIYLLLAAVLICLNAFFVLAEFAIVKLRPSRVEQLVTEGNPRARIVQHIQTHMDEYLSVCQVGITVASIALGFVGEPGFAHLFIYLTGASSALAHSVAVTAALILSSALHVVIGEQVPKMFALRKPEGAALIVAHPMRFWRIVFLVPLVLLTGATRAILRLLNPQFIMKVGCPWLSLRSRAGPREHHDPVTVGS